MARSAAELMGAKATTLWRADEPARRLDLVAASDPQFLAELPVKAVRWGEGGVGWAAEHRQRLTVDVREEDPRLILSDWFLARGLRAAMAVPILYGEALLGVLGLASDRPFRLTQDEETLLGGFVAQAATAVEHVRLLAEARQHQREAEVLADLARGIGASLDLGTVLRRVVEGARDLCEAESARIALREEGTDALVLGHLVGHRTRRFEGFQVRPGQGLGGQVLLTGRPVRTDDWAADPRFGKSEFGDIVRDEGIVCQIAAPVLIAGRIDGLLYVDRRVPHPFTDREESLLVHLAEHAAIAIANGRLFAREQAARQEAETARTRYRSLFDSVPVGLLRTRPDGTILDVNRALVATLRYPDRDTLLATSAPDLWAEPAERDGWREALERDGTARDREARLRRHDGSFVWARTSFSSETILLVEDNDDVRAIAEQMLDHAGYIVLATGRPKEALGLLMAHPGRVHLLLTDVVMPGMSGSEVARQVRAARPEVRVLFKSGHADDMLVLRGVQDRSSGFLGKPFTRNTLLAKVRETLDA